MVYSFQMTHPTSHEFMFNAIAVEVHISGKSNVHYPGWSESEATSIGFLYSQCDDHLLTCALWQHKYMISDLKVFSFPKPELRWFFCYDSPNPMNNKLKLRSPHRGISKGRGRRSRDDLRWGTSGEIEESSKRSSCQVWQGVLRLIYRCVFLRSSRFFINRHEIRLMYVASI